MIRSRIRRFVNRGGELPFGMFDVQYTEQEARRARRLENIYHVGQDRIWDGREVLQELIAKHGQPKLAASSQAHDEARHFYVMHDYLHAIDAMPKEMDFWSRRVVELTLGVDDLAKKLYGMQLTIEVIALTIFQRVRELEVEPVLTELLPYYERDEARHVGLGTQLVPSLIQGMTPAQQLDFALFELDLLLSTLMGLKGMEPDLLSIGVDPRSILGVGFRKITEVNKVMKSEFPDFPDDPPITRIFHGVSELLFPQEGAGAAVPLPRRAKHAALVAARRMEGVIEIWSRRGRVDADPPIVHA